MYLGNTVTIRKSSKHAYSHHYTHAMTCNDMHLGRLLPSHTHAHPTTLTSVQTVSATRLPRRAGWLSVPSLQTSTFDHSDSVPQYRSATFNQVSPQQTPAHATTTTAWPRPIRCLELHCRLFSAKGPLNIGLFCGK